MTPPAPDDNADVRAGLRARPVSHGDVGGPAGARSATVRRETRETRVEVTVTLDDAARPEVRTGIGFFDHMLTLLGAHGSLGMRVAAEGDLEVDDHHTVEDVGICLGQALREALGDRTGIVRFGHALLPMDEALALVAVDVSGRGFLAFDAEFPARAIGRFDVELVEEFLRALAANAGITLHVRLLSGRNGHHVAEAIFKGTGRALRDAFSLDPLRPDIPSTKGTLSG